MKIVEKIIVKLIEIIEIFKIKIKLDIDIQFVVDEIVIEIIIFLKIFIQSFIQFLQFVLEQRELVKSKVDVKVLEIIDNSDFEKSKIVVFMMKIFVKVEIVVFIIKFFVKSLLLVLIIFF